MTEYLQSSDGTTLAYERTGAGPALIIIGGALNSRRSADALVPLLAPRFTVYAYDRRGRGESTDTGPYAVAREVEDLGALIDAAGGSAYAYGHSSGAILALEAAAAGAPLTKLAAYEPPYLTGDVDPEPPEEFLARMKACLEAGDRAGAVEMFIRHTGADFHDSVKDMPWWPGLLSLAHTLPYDLALAGDGTVPAERLAKIRAEALGLYGGASQAWAGAAVAAVAKAVPGMSTLVIPGQDHAVANEVLAPVLIDFFG